MVDNNQKNLGWDVKYTVLYLFITVLSAGLSKVAGRWRKLPPTWLVSADYSALHVLTDGVLLMKNPWTGRLLSQLSRLLQNFLTTLNYDELN